MSRIALLSLGALFLLGAVLMIGRVGGDGGESVSTQELEAATFERLLREAAREGITPDPWLIAHLLLATEDPTVQKEWRETLLRLWLQDREGAPHFPLHTETGRGEQHPDLVFKVLAELAAEVPGVPPPTELSALARTAIARFTPPTTFEEWNDVAWFLQGLAYLSERPEFSITGATRLGGAATAGDEKSEWTLTRLAEETLGVVETLDRVVEAALRAEGVFVRPSATEGPEIAGVYATTCGGQHLLQAVVTCLRAGILPPEARDRVAARIDVLIARLGAEERFREREEGRALAAGISTTRAARHRVETTLKLHGHALETLSLAALALPDRREAIQASLREEVERTAHLLEIRSSVLDPAGTVVPRLRTEAPLAFELWFGDGAHALHGLRLARAILTASD